MRGLRADAIYRRGSLKNVEIFIDGASKGNPGPSGIGIAIYQNGRLLKEISRYIGNATNNVAEYYALIFALQEALVLDIREIKVKTDSELLYKQLKGEYKIKNSHLILLHEQVKHMLCGFRSADIAHISRDDNQPADRLAAQAIRDVTKQAMFPF